MDIDILKAIGVLCIILAHVNPPGVIFQIRNFDVVLMILLSAYLGLITYKKDNYFKYIIKRFIRLVIPTWIFLFLFFLLSIIFNIIPVDKKTIIESIAFGSGIGYVWIIRIYLIVALLIPLCKRITEKYSKLVVILSTIALYIIYEL